MKFVLEHGQARFRCPGCKCDHAIPVQGDKAWGFNGDAAKPSTTPSIVFWTEDFTDPEDPGFHIPGMRCHSWITDGMIRFFDDCTHDLKGQTVELPEMEAA